MEAAAAAALAADGMERKVKDMMSIRKKNESFHESESEMEVDDVDNSFTFQNTSCEMSQADCEDLEKNEPESKMMRKKKNHMLPIPLQPRRMSSVGDLPFEEAIFAPVESSPSIMIKNTDENKAIFDTMSSYEDLKFLLKELRRWSGGKLLASFGMSKTCTVVPPKSWNESRRTAFVQWTTVHLGFCFKSCGGGVNYLQINSSKAKELQEDLEKAILEHKEACRKKNNERDLPSRKEGKLLSYKSQHRTPLPMSSIKISRISKNL